MANGPGSTKLPVGGDGYRVGHPEKGRATLTVCEVASPQWLATSTNTVRSLIVNGTISGYWYVRGVTFGYRAYRDDVERFLADHGSFPAARHRRRKTPSESDGTTHPSSEQLPSALQLLLEEVGRLRSQVEQQGRQITELERALRVAHEDPAIARSTVLRYVREALSDQLR